MVKTTPLSSEMDKILRYPSSLTTLSPKHEEGTIKKLYQYNRGRKTYRSPCQHNFATTLQYHRKSSPELISCEVFPSNKSAYKFLPIPERQKLRRQCFRRAALVNDYLLENVHCIKLHNARNVISSFA